MQTVMLIYKLFGGSVNSGIPGEPTNMFNYSGPRGVKVGAPRPPLCALGRRQCRECQGEGGGAEACADMASAHSRHSRSDEARLGNDACALGAQVKGVLDKEEVLRAKHKGHLFATPVVVGTPECLAELAIQPSAFPLCACLRAIAVDELDGYSEVGSTPNITMKALPGRETLPHSGRPHICAHTQSIFAVLLPECHSCGFHSEVALLPQSCL